MTMRYTIHADDTPIDQAVDLTDAEDIADARAREDGRTIAAYDTMNAETVYTAPKTLRGTPRLRAPGGGRKPIADKPMATVRVTLTEEQVARARVVGKGNVSAGVRALIDAAR